MMQVSERRRKTCCFTGHRYLPTDKVQEIAKQTADEIRALILHKGVRFFGVGGAIGYDTLAAEVLFQLRETEFPHIEIVLVYPFDGFTSRWTAKQKADYESRLCRYDKIVCVSDTACREAYFLRNRCLVDDAAYCIAYCTRNHSGTAYTVKYAREQGVEVHNLGESETAIPDRESSAAP